MIKKSLTYTYLCLFTAMVIALVYAYVLWPFGLEVQNDSCSYVRGALSLQQGLGFTYAGKYLNHFPAGLSVVYASLSSLFHVSIFNVALWFHILCIFLLGLLLKTIFDLIQIAPPLQILGLLLYLFSAPVWNISTKLLTELPSLVLLTACSLLLFRYLKNDRKTVLLPLLGFLLGAGIIFRFAMIGFLAGFLLVVFWQHRFNWRDAILRCIYLALPAIIGVAAYNIYVQLHYQQALQDRMMVWHPISLQQIYFFIRTPFTWFFEVDYTQAKTLFFLFGAGFVLMLMLVVNYNSSQSSNRNQISEFFAQQKSIYWAMTTLIIVYIVFLILSVSLFDAATPIDTRILSPLSIYVYLLLLSCFNYLYLHARFKWLAQWSLFGLVCVFNWAATQALPYRHQYPHGYNTPYWHRDAKAIVCDSQEVWLRQHRTIYTNAYYYWRLHDDRPTHKIPQNHNPFTLIKNKHLHNDLLALQNEIANDSAQLVYFNYLKKNTTLPSKQTLLTYFSDSSRFDVVPFEGGFIIQGKKQRH